MNYTPQELPNMGIIRAAVPEELRPFIDCELDFIRSTGEAKSYREKLVGVIRKEYEMVGLMDNSAFQQMLFSLVRAYEQHWPMWPKYLSFNTGQQSLKVDKMWVNFQKKYEYNPVHDHEGVYTFVIWHTIPYDLKEEVARLPGQRAPSQSMFHITYTNVLGEIIDWPFEVDKSWEWEMILFPAKMKHHVHPFYTSDGERISISGNLALTGLQSPPPMLL